MMKISNNTAIESFEVNVPATVGAYSTTISWVMQIGLIRAKWFNKVAFGGDYVSVQVAPNTPIGVVLTGATTGENTFHCSPTVIDNIEIGFVVVVNGQDLGRVVSVDLENQTITTEHACTSDIAAMSYVLRTINIVPYLYLDAVDSMMVFDGGDDLMILPANAPMVVTYHNVNGTAKDYSVKIEYKY